MLLSKLGSDAGSESSTRTPPAIKNNRLPIPKEQNSHPGIVKKKKFQNTALEVSLSKKLSTAQCKQSKVKLKNPLKIVFQKYFARPDSRTRSESAKHHEILFSETSDITSVCSLSASAGAEAEYINMQHQSNEK